MLLVLGDLAQRLKGAGVLRDNGTLLEHGNVLREADAVGKVVYIRKKRLSGHASKRVLEPLAQLRAAEESSQSITPKSALDNNRICGNPQS